MSQVYGGAVHFYSLSSKITFDAMTTMMDKLFHIVHFAFSCLGTVLVNIKDYAERPMYIVFKARLFISK